MFGESSFAAAPFASQSQGIDLTKYIVRNRKVAISGPYSPEVLERAKFIRRVPPYLDRVPEDITPHQNRSVRPEYQWFWMLDKIVNRTRLRRPAPRYDSSVPSTGLPTRLDEGSTNPWKEPSTSDTFATKTGDSDSLPVATEGPTVSLSKRVEDSESYARRTE